MSNIKHGCIFRTKSGRNLDRSNIYHSMVKLCGDAQVEPSKVFPHNFQTSFCKNVFIPSKRICPILPVILGHSSIETTRIYVAASIKQYEKIMNKMKIEIDKQKPQNNYSVVPLQSKERPQNNYSVVLSSLYTV
ncbi:MAG: hypothetical protein ACLR0U_17165 [Enterocloster clostridioformis]